MLLDHLINAITKKEQAGLDINDCIICGRPGIYWLLVIGHLISGVGPVSSQPGKEGRTFIKVASFGPWFLPLLVPGIPKEFCFPVIRIGLGPTN